MPDIERWRATWHGLGIETVNDELYAVLNGRYAERHRKYHTARHLDECFARLDESRGLAVHPFEIELAIWFDDAVYDVHSQDNEERSSAWAQDVSGQAGLPAPVGARVRELILATKHDARPPSADAALLVDVDLAILAAPAERFDEYERQIREEYGWVPGLLFRRKRREILEGFLSRPHVYNTSYFRDRYEDSARANLSRSIAQLGE